jgi:phosphate transport system substrate-binding protein
MKAPTILFRHALVVVLLTASACAGDDEETSPAFTTNGEVSGIVQVAGSSTLGPFATEAARLFGNDNPRVRVAVSISGTGGGFERFCAGETDISNASRPIAEAEERACRRKGINYFDFPVANDAVTLITSKQNDWADCLTTQQLERIWQPGSRLERWSQVDPSFPDEELRLFGPDTDSGTFNFFTEEINGESGATRSDYTRSEEDSATVRGVSASRGGLGYLGFSYYAANRDSLNAVAVDGPGICVVPSVETVHNGTYKPLSRPLYVYVNTASFKRAAVRKFVRFMLTGFDAPLSALDARLIPLTERQLAQAERAFRRAAS